MYSLLRALSISFCHESKGEYRKCKYVRQADQVHCKPKLKLVDRVSEVMRFNVLLDPSALTREWIKRFIFSTVNSRLKPSEARFGRSLRQASEVRKLLQD
jgi:hypothetical protein